MSSWLEWRVATAQAVHLSDDALIIDCVDGRTISAPLVWYPRLLHGSPAERNHWRLIGSGASVFQTLACGSRSRVIALGR